MSAPDGVRKAAVDNIQKLEDSGWIGAREKGVTRSLISSLRARTAKTSFKKLEGDDPWIRKALVLAQIAANRNDVDEINLRVDPTMLLSGAKLSLGSPSPSHTKE
jgi:hypothetical protein